MTMKDVSQVRGRCLKGDIVGGDRIPYTIIQGAEALNIIEGQWRNVGNRVEILCAELFRDVL